MNISNILRIRSLSIEEQLRELGYGEATKDTYLYINQRGELDAMEKQDRRSYPQDELESIGYARRGA